MNALVIPRARRAAAGVVTAAVLLAAGSARADVMCDDASSLPNPIIVSGSIGFEPTLRLFATKLSAEPSPSTIIYAGAYPSCTAIANVVGAMDLGGASGRYYISDGTTLSLATCTFAAGQKVHVAISDVFYESCSALPQPRPAGVMDVPGPVQAVLFVVPSANTTQYLSYAEARGIYGCGVSTAAPLAGFADAAGVFCRDPNAGPQMILASNLGLPASAMVAPRCIDTGTTTGMIGNLTYYAGSGAGPGAVGFVPADGLDMMSTVVKALAFQSLGQTQAYFVDSAPDRPDRRNVRDGHYPVWGYEHLIAPLAGGSLGRQAADFIAWVSGTKTSLNLDGVGLESAAGLIPQCAMRVKRSSDGGLLSPYTPPQPCACAFEAAISGVIPPGCVLCTSDSLCAGGARCRHGFCE